MNHPNLDIEYQNFKRFLHHNFKKRWITFIWKTEFDTKLTIKWRKINDNAKTHIKCSPKTCATDILSCCFWNMKLLKILSLLIICFETVFGTRWSFKGFDPIDLTVDRHCDHHAKAYLGKAFEDMQTDHKEHGSYKELVWVSKRCFLVSWCVISDQKCHFTVIFESLFQIIYLKPRLSKTYSRNQENFIESPKV